MLWPAELSAQAALPLPSNAALVNVMICSGVESAAVWRSLLRNRVAFIRGSNFEMSGKTLVMENNFRHIGGGGF